MLTDSDVFIFTEVVNCGLIGRIAFKTFHQFHNRKLHIYGRTEDFEAIEEHPNNVLHNLDDRPDIIEAFQAGHRGTSKIWAKAIIDAKEKYMVHIDSDVVFRGDAVEEVIQKLGEYDIVGSMRNYPNNPHKHRNDVRHLPDVTATYCFGFNRELIPVREHHLLERLVENSLDQYVVMEMASRHPWYRYEPTIDYFDPVAFIIIQHGGKVHILSNDVMGGFDDFGGKKNKYGDLNKDCDFGDKIVHFATVGSGLNFYQKQKKGIKIDVPEWYVIYGIGKFDLYLRLFYNRSIMADSENPFLKYYDMMKEALKNVTP
jgi:hypothetical protein